MNIGIFSDTYFPQLNGVATSVRTLARALEKKGHTVYIFTPSDPRLEEVDEPNVFRIPSIPFIFVRHYRASILCSPTLLYKIKALQLDIIHTQTEFTLGALGKYVSTTCGIPMVHTYHTMYEDYVHYIGGGYLISQEMAREFSKMFCNAAMGVIAPTQKTEQLLLHYGVNKPISIIPTGIDFSHFRKEQYDPNEILNLRKSLGLEADTPVVLSLGRIAKEKSIDTIVSAMPSLLEKLPHAKMVIVGEGMEVENLQRLGTMLGISDSLIFTGGKPWSEIGKYYQLGNVFCSASTSETQGLTFAEAMAAGIPVVAKRDECIENIVNHQETGLLFETAEELSLCLYEMLTDRPLQERICRAARKAIEQLSVENFATSVEQLYQETMSSEFQPRRIPGAAIPLVIGAKAARGIVLIPKNIAYRTMAYSQLVASKFHHNSNRS